MKKYIFAFVVLLSSSAFCLAQAANPADAATVMGSYSKKLNNAAVKSKEKSKIKLPAGLAQEYSFLDYSNWQRKVKNYKEAKNDVLFFKSAQYSPVLEYLPEAKIREFIENSLKEYYKAVFKDGKVPVKKEYSYIPAYADKKLQKLMIELSKQPENIIFTESNFDYSSILKEGTDYLIINENHYVGHERHTGEMIPSLRKNANLSAAGFENITTHVQEGEGIEKFQETGTPQFISAFSDAFSLAQEDIMNHVYERLSGVKIFALEETRDIFCGVNFNFQPRLGESRFFQTLMKYIEEHTSVLLEESGRSVNFRNASWIKNIEKNKTPGLTLLYMGLQHGRYNNPWVLSISEILLMNGYKTTVVSFIDQHTSPMLKNIAHKDKKYIIKVPAEYVSILGADYLIYIPPGMQDIGPFAVAPVM